MMSERLADNGYGEALLEIAEEVGCEIDNRVLKDIWCECTETTIFKDNEVFLAETGVSAETGGILAGILNIFAKIKIDLTFNEETRKVI